MEDTEVLDSNRTIGILSYLHILVISLIPMLGFFYSILWAFRPNVDKNRKNLARAILILQVLIIILLIIVIMYIWNNVVVPLKNTINESILSSYTVSPSIDDTLNEVKSYDFDFSNIFAEFSL